MTEDQKIMLKNMGALSYPIDKILNILSIKDPVSFTKEFTNPESEIHRIYKSGQDEAQFVLDLKLLQMAKEGDMKAMDKINAKKRQAEMKEQADQRRERRQ